jgi:hypothetical protein
LKLDLGRGGRRVGVWAYRRAGLGGGPCPSRKNKKVYALGATRRYAYTPIPRYVFPESPVYCHLSLRDAFCRRLRPQALNTYQGFRFVCRLHPGNSV